ncbi:cupin domain-containing protein [Paenibacillus arenilitoris]|uniref:Cupin domain-containing protein n=1 Tax=Paenibacillus arenilitoris TaxID=2772299 RepID=A0A927H877_9BACL|nr:cupin domain-containing protein [Paenibacillus arenilitoris]MBD2871398.1 cupin domain-containing protein [Paenibacillus arenilitoris]
MSERTLVHPDGRTVTLLDSGSDAKGPYLLVEHRVVRQGAMNGPHWHPELQEKFTIKEGRMRFVIDGEETIVEQGGEATIRPRQVHRFWNVSDHLLIALHEVRPPGRHWQMFELIHKLEREGKLNEKGIPSNPLWLAAAWSTMDGYIQGPPKFVQDVFLGGLARLADRLGYRV